MKKFLLGVGVTLGALAIGQKLYDKGYDDAKAEETVKQIQKDSSKKKENK